MFKDVIEFDQMVNLIDEALGEDSKSILSTCINRLHIDSVSKEYRRGKVKANCNITVSFYPGQITAVIGHNGAGKTTLLNQIIGIVKPDSGNVIYQGASLLSDARMARELVSIMPQFHAPLAGVTLRQSIESILYIRCKHAKQVKLYADQILIDLDIERWANQAGDKLSGGVQRLASFAMAVVYPTPIILLDEPTNDVDPVRRRLIWKYMRRLAQNGHIIIVVTHNLLEVEEYADRYLLLHQGRLIQDASTGVLNQRFANNTLTAIVSNKNILNEAPDAVEIKYSEEDFKLVMTLSSEQVIDAITWILKMIDEGNIINYKLSSASLDASYGGMINE